MSSDRVILDDPIGQRGNKQQYSQLTMTPEIKRSNVTKYVNTHSLVLI